jgi:hypothetical protein
MGSRMLTRAEALGVETLLLQNWITANTTTVGVGAPVPIPTTQSSDSWLDLGEYEDIVVYLDVRQVTGTVNMTYATAPSRQEQSFMAVVPAFAMATGLRVDKILASYAFVPPARFFRWSISCPATGTGGATFRIWVVAYSFGG